MNRAPSWATSAERGSIGALRAMAWFYRRFGRSISVALLTPIAAYFLLRDGKSRRGSLQYLRRLHAWPQGRRAWEREPGLRESLRHFRAFAINIFDRLRVWTGEADRFEIRDDGGEHLFRLAQEGRGAILLGAHVGSFEMLRVLAERQKLAVNVLMFTRHVEKITSFFERLHPGERLRVIQMDPGSIRSIFEIKACIDRGEFVGMMGDRVWESHRHRSVSIPFLGRHARFPLDPFLLQAVLGCPLLLTVCIRTGPGRYAASTQPFAPAGVVPRRDRVEHAEELAKRYVAALEEWCVRAPYQWFNFFEFWRDERKE